jgi:hypothetical protein
MSAETGPVELLRIFCQLEQRLPPQLTLEQRAIASGQLAYRLAHPQHRPPGLTLEEGLRRCYRALPVQPLSARQRAFLLFVTGLALGSRSRDPQRARGLLGGAVEWSRLLGPERELRDASETISWQQRMPVYLLKDVEQSGIEATLETVEQEAQLQLEPGFELRADISGFVPVGQVLDGLNAWECVVQQELGWRLSETHDSPAAAVQTLLEKASPWLAEVGKEALAVWLRDEERQKTA